MRRFLGLALLFLCAAPRASLAQSAPVPAAPATQLGISAERTDPSRAAMQQNAQGYALHRRRDYAGALTRFDAAIALASDFTTARYNRACALSRLNRIADSVQELDRVIALDLAEFGPRIDSDPDLAAVRSSAEYPAFSQRRTAAATAHTAAIARGVPALTFRLRTPESDEETYSTSQRLHRRMRAGVWLPTERRFLPFTPAASDTLGVIWSSASRTATILRGSLATMYYQFYPTQLRVDVVSLDRPGTIFATALHLENTVLATARSSGFIDPALEPESALFELFEHIGVRPSANGPQIVNTTGTGSTAHHVLTNVQPSGASTTRTASSDPLYTWSAHGIILANNFPAGVSVERGQLRIPRRSDPIAIGTIYPTERRYFTSSDGRFGYFLSVRHECDPTELAHRLVRIELNSFAVTVLSEGASGAFLVQGADGILYAQIGTSVRRINPADQQLVDAGFPSWLFLGPTMLAMDCTM